MPSTPRALSVLLALAGGAAAAATTPPQTAATPARFANVPARPLVVEDMRIRVAVPPGRSDLDGDLDRRTVDLREPDGLAALRGALVELDQFAQAQDDYQDAHPEHVLPFRYDVGSSGKRRALREMIAITDDLLASAPSAAGEPPGAMAAGREGEVLRLLELHHAVDNSFRYPIKKNYELVPDILPSLLIRSRSHRTVERSDEPGLRVAGSSDPSRDDPEASSFWSPTDPAAADLYAGFGRAAIPRYDGICEYQEPKT